MHHIHVKVELVPQKATVPDVAQPQRAKVERETAGMGSHARERGERENERGDKHSVPRNKERERERACAREREKESERERESDTHTHTHTQTNTHTHTQTHTQTHAQTHTLFSSQQQPPSLNCQHSPYLSPRPHPSCRQCRTNPPHPRWRQLVLVCTISVYCI